MVIYTPRGKSGGRDDHIHEYPVEESRFPSLAQAAREANEAWQRQLEREEGQNALDALERLTGLDLDKDGDIGVRGSDQRNLLGGAGRSDDFE